MSRLSLNDWYRYLESQFEKAESSDTPSSEPVVAATPAPEPTPAPAETARSVAPAEAPAPPSSATREKGYALVSLRIPHIAEFVPLLRQELHWEPPAESTPSPAQAEPASTTAEPPSDGPRLRKRKGRRKPAPETIVPPEADEVWAKLPRYLRYLAEWTDDSVTCKYYPVRGRDESREELIARLTDPVLTLEETARLLGVCPATVRRYTDRGWLHCFRTEGNQRRFRLSDIVAFLEAQAMRQPRGNRSSNETAP